MLEATLSLLIYTYFILILNWLLANTFECLNFIYSLSGSLHPSFLTFVDVFPIYRHVLVTIRPLMFQVETKGEHPLSQD
jgi:hypothetical protein